MLLLEATPHSRSDSHSVFPRYRAFPNAWLSDSSFFLFEYCWRKLVPILIGMTLAHFGKLSTAPFRKIKLIIGVDEIVWILCALCVFAVIKKVAVVSNSCQ